MDLRRREKLAVRSSSTGLANCEYPLAGGRRIVVGPPSKRAARMMKILQRVLLVMVISLSFAAGAVITMRVMQRASPPERERVLFEEGYRTGYNAGFLDGEQ